jgi:CheY-like chemotaxis protein
MDVPMPEVDGLDATREIRRRLPFDRQPVIFGLTAHATTQYRDICLAAGMSGYLSKPLDRDKLRRLIEGLSTRSQLRKLASSVESEGLVEGGFVPNAGPLPGGSVLSEKEFGLK